VSIILTGQTHDVVQGIPDIARVEIGPPNSDERRSLLLAHGLQPSEIDNALTVAAAFSSAFDIALAAQCWKSLTTDPTRYQLIHAYGRGVSDALALGPEAFSFLCAIARRMADEVASGLDLHEVYRLMPSDVSGPGVGWTKLLNSGLLRIERLNIIFR